MTTAVSLAGSHSGLHVFVDANIFLSFFRYTENDLGALRRVFASHEDGVVTVYLTQQVQDEVHRNREKMLNSAMATFRKPEIGIKTPSFVQNYPEAQQLIELLKNMTATHKQLRDKIEADIRTKGLLADRLLKDIFESGRVLPRNNNTDEMAIRRMHVGNPPGKKGSVGDAINWLTLLKEVPCKKDIHIISEDGDFFSLFDKTAPNPFLSNEWTDAKSSILYVYRGLKPFMEKHFDGTDFALGIKAELISRLKHSPSFATTHDIVAELEDCSYYSLVEVLQVLDAVVQNDQVHWIVGDSDVSDFLIRITEPYLHEITDSEHKTILEDCTATPETMANVMSTDAKNVS